MKRFAAILCLTLLVIKSYAQPQLWGTMQVGSAPLYTGSLFHINGDGTSFTNAPNFNGSSPQGNVVLHNGLLYGVTTSGGTNIIGDIFSYNPVTSSYSTLFSFDSLDGYYPRAGLFLASNGKFYGTTTNGGAYNFGTVFSYDPVNYIYTKYHDMNGPDGKYPQGNVVEYNGKLYGMTTSGGTNSSGVIFSLDVSSGAYTVAYDFDFTNGFSPWGTLLVYNSALYGLAFGGGTNGYGVLFKFDVQNGITVLHNLDGVNGSAPMAGLCIAGNSLMYGTTSQGGLYNKGTMFSYDLSGNSFTKLHDFDTINGSSPFGDLMQASDGKLYGTTYNGGAGNVGIIFSYDIGASQFTKIHDCMLATGAFPNDDLLELNVTSVAQHDGKLQLKIVSNPVTDVLDIICNTFSGDVQLSIFSMEGKKIMNQSLTTTGEDGRTRININLLSPGIYMLTVVSEDERSLIRFVKQ